MHQRNQDNQVVGMLVSNRFLKDVLFGRDADFE